MAGEDFSIVNKVNPATFNRALWLDLKGNEPYPTVSMGADLRKNRARLVEESQIHSNKACLAQELQ